MPDFKTFLTEIGRGLERSDIPFMIIGGQAVLVHGEPRLTQDIDVRARRSREPRHSRQARAPWPSPRPKI